VAEKSIYSEESKALGEVLGGLLESRGISKREMSAKLGLSHRV